jgi:hypothetical protein
MSGLILIVREGMQQKQRSGQKETHGELEKYKRSR